MSSDKIFISIASANEKDLKQTVLSAIGNSENPENLTFGIFDLCMNNFPETNFDYINNIFYMPMKFSGTLGVGMSRLIATSMIPPEFDYTLQIDAHMIFTKNWDLELKKYYKKLESMVDRPIITSRPRQWVYDKYNNIIVDDLVVEDINNFVYVDTKSVSKLVLSNYQKSLMLNGYPAPEGMPHGEEDFVEHNLISGNFVFSRSDLYKEILHDPRLPWGGDETVYALRAWTRGYRMFSIKPNICFHYDKKTSEIAYGKHPDSDWRHLNNNDSRLYNFYLNRYKESKKIIQDILTGEYFGYWGAPNHQKLKEFEHICGVNFKDFYTIEK